MGKLPTLLAKRAGFQFCLLAVYGWARAKHQLTAGLKDIVSFQNRLLKVCYVPAASAGLPGVSFFFPFLFLLLQPLAVLMKQKGWLYVQLSSLYS